MVAGVPPTVTGNTVTPVTVPISAVEFQYNLPLQGYTVYNTYGTTNGGDMTFTTMGPPPAVVTTAAATAVAAKHRYIKRNC